MPAAARCQRSIVAGLLIAGIFAPAARLPAGEPKALLPEMADDAALHDVAFVDADRGWAVGDRGVIWHTDDSGRNWRQQTSPVACRLHAVCFLDAQHGWIVGGWSEPHTHDSQGVVLRTRDGGRRWERLTGLTLPALKTIRMLDLRRGWAVGDRSPLHPSGLFFTDDGGRSWASLPGATRSGYLAADFHDEGVGAAAGFDGVLAFVRRGGAEAARTPPVGPRPLRQVLLVDRTSGWLVGDGGLVLFTPDGGLSWTAPATSPPAELTAQCDFHGVAVRGDHVWIVGEPGSVVLHSPDNGRTWDIQRTSVSTPLHRVTFLDEQRGFAVGALGMVLGTRDGGRSWRVLRSGGRRAALAVISASADTVPWELLVNSAGNDGYLAVVDVLGRHDFELPELATSHAADRIDEAALAVGAAASRWSWRFPLRQAGLGLSPRDAQAAWDAVHDGRGAAQLEELLVRRLRTWRPDVVVVPGAAGDDRGAAPLVQRAVLAAVEKANDRGAHPEHLYVAGLEPWRVGRVATIEPGAGGGEFTLVTAQLAHRLGGSLSEGAHTPRTLVTKDAPASPPSLVLHKLIDRLPAQGGPRDLWSGVNLSPGGEARRRLSEPSSGSLEALRRRAQLRRNADELIARSGQAAPAAAILASQLDDLTRGLSSDAAGAILQRLAQRCLAEGEVELAAETFHRLAEQHGEHPAGRAAWVWLVGYYGSGEMAWRLAAQSQATVRVAAAEAVAVEPVRATGRIEPLPPVDQPWSQAAGKRRGGGLTAVRGHDRLARTQGLVKQLERTSPALAALPEIRFPLAAAQRQTGAGRAAESFYQSLASLPPHDPLAACARAELWLAAPSPNPPRPVAVCRLQNERPRLDGQLNEPLWSTARPLPLTQRSPGDTAGAAEVLLAGDAQFLYLAARIAKAPGVEYPPKAQRRRYDEDLSGRDRLELLLDIDRDWTSYWRLAIDSRGCTAESCWGDRSWNPTWYVATADDDASWTIEAAIPWEELTRQPPAPRDAWAIGVQRVVPGVGLQAWSHPAGVEPLPAGFGVLLFE